MAKELAQQFRTDMDEVHRQLVSVPVSLADVPWREGGWTRKQIIGHLLDSAANNRQRFVRATLDGAYDGPGYAQDSWVHLHGYAEQSWNTLLRWWEAEHEILAELVDRIPNERLAAECVIAGGAPVTLQFVIDDYVAHQKHHLAQIMAA